MLPFIFHRLVFPHEAVWYSVATPVSPVHLRRLLQATLEADHWTETESSYNYTAPGIVYGSGEYSSKNRANH